MSALTAARDHPAPGVSEKSIDRVGTAMPGGKYTFAVHPTRTRSRSRTPIEELYAKEKVTVVARQRPDDEGQGEDAAARKRGRIRATTSPWRKAIVTLAPGQKIEFFEGV